MRKNGFKFRLAFHEFVAMLVFAAQHEFILVAAHFQHRYRELKLIELPHPLFNSTYRFSQVALKSFLVEAEGPLRRYHVLEARCIEI